MISYPKLPRKHFMQSLGFFVELIDFVVITYWSTQRSTSHAQARRGQDHCQHLEKRQRRVSLRGHERLISLYIMTVCLGTC